MSVWLQVLYVCKVREKVCLDVKILTLGIRPDLGVKKKSLGVWYRSDSAGVNLAGTSEVRPMWNLFTNPISVALNSLEGK